MKYIRPVITIIDLTEGFRPAVTLSHGSDAASCFYPVYDR